MEASIKIAAIILIIILDILAFTKFKNYFTYEIEEYLLINDNGKIIKKLSYEEAKHYSELLEKNSTI